MRRYLLLAVLIATALFLPVVTNKVALSAPVDPPVLTWTHLSTETGEIPVPSDSHLQTAALIFDIDGDGLNDFVIASQREPGAAVVWYRRQATGWTKYLIDGTVLSIEAGGADYDIDGDGDLDLVLGGDRSSNQLWWWENPSPNYDPNVGWTRRLIKDSGAPKHHDLIFGDFDGDGQAELVFWNQRGKALWLAEIPADPHTTEPWPATTIYSWKGGREHEGLAQADIDGDGQVDIIGGGRWFKHESGTIFTPQVIDDQLRYSRAAVGQLIPGGRPEVVLSAGDVDGPLKWYEWDGSRWRGHDLLGSNIRHGHSLALADFNQDGQLDIFAAEMRLNGKPRDAKMWILFGNGAGDFQKTEIASGLDNHETKVADLDGDGDLDILGKPYNWETPRLDLWLNESSARACGSLDQWQRHLIDADKPWRSLFVTSADVNGDGFKDIITGGWWYQNPGSPGAAWSRQTIGSPLDNIAGVYDLDEDGDSDVLGTEGQGSEANANLVWARNDGAGRFTVLNNLPPGEGDFLQGVAVDHFQADGPLEVALSWHRRRTEVQMLTVPADPSTEQWGIRTITAASQDEALSAGDIDRDGDLDLLQGTQWLRNDNAAGQGWTPLPLFSTRDHPDRNRLVDMNGDGLLDAVIGYEAISVPGKLAWYEQPANAAKPWLEHPIATVVGPMSLDVADADGDGDLDVVVGEHNLKKPATARLLVLENVDGNALDWREHLVYTGDEHHDGAQVVDIDGDGDFDIVSIGWSHGQVLLYENTAPVCNGRVPTTPPVK